MEATDTVAVAVLPQTITEMIATSVTWPQCHTERPNNRAHSGTYNLVTSTPHLVAIFAGALSIVADFIQAAAK